MKVVVVRSAVEALFSDCAIWRLQNGVPMVLHGIFLSPMIFDHLILMESFVSSCPLKWQIGWLGRLARGLGFALKSDIEVV